MTGLKKGVQHALLTPSANGIIIIDMPICRTRATGKLLLRYLMIDRKP